MTCRTLRPLIAICGTTGVGKSDLAIELALEIGRRSRASLWKGARIINADAMQVYRGLDIITNKVPEPERHGIEHLLMDFKTPGEQYVVGQWVQDALKAIEETYQRNQVPIVVGGTLYWIQHLIFPNRLSNSSTLLPDQVSPLSTELLGVIASLPQNMRSLFDDLPEQPPSAGIEPDAAFALHTLLSELDPPVASRWHWRDTRKVLRSLRLIKESGRRASEIIKDQTNDVSTITPRFRTLCFWLYAEPKVLEPRLNKRVDKMLEQGLLDEIRSLRGVAESSQAASAAQDTNVKENVDYSLGIYQSIGYREFNEYLCGPVQQTEKNFAEAVARMKISTRQYARRQISWLRNKLLPLIYSANAADDAPTVPTYLLDATEIDKEWIARVRFPAMDITESFLEHRNLPDPLSLSANARKMLSIDKKAVDPASVLNARQKLICPVCTTRLDRPFMVEEGREWDIHRRTRVHRQLADKQSRSLNNDSCSEFNKGNNTK